MKKQFSQLSISVSFILIASLLCILFWLHLSSLNEIKDYSQQQALSQQTLLLGSAIMVLFVISLITQFRLNNQNSKVQNELFISHEWFSNTLLSIGEAVITTDKTGGITYMNKTAEALTGWTLSETKGKSVDIIFDTIDQSTHLPIDNPIQRALKENKVIPLANHTILIKKNKSQLIIVDSAAPIHDDNGQIAGVILVFRDVTEQSRTHDDLVKSEGLLKAIMDHTSSMIAVKDMEGKYLMINNQEKKIYSNRVPATSGNDLQEEQLLVDEAVKSKESDVQVVRQGLGVEYEQIITHPDGTQHAIKPRSFRFSIASTRCGL